MIEDFFVRLFKSNFLVVKAFLQEKLSIFTEFYFMVFHKMVSSILFVNNGWHSMITMKLLSYSIILNNLTLYIQSLNQRSSSEAGLLFQDLLLYYSSTIESYTNPFYKKLRFANIQVLHAKEGQLDRSKKLPPPFPLTLFR